jgi:hypothetical protein
VSTSPFTGTTAFQYQGQTFLAGMAQGGMLGWPPYAGMFHLGGVVPGPPGQERMALVKSGETITPPPSQTGGSMGGTVFAAALRENTVALREHAGAVKANTTATHANTDATSKLPASFSRAAAPRHPYSSSLSSERIVDLGVGG